MAPVSVCMSLNRQEERKVLDSDWSPFLPIMLEPIVLQVSFPRSWDARMLAKFQFSPMMVHRYVTPHPILVRLNRSELTDSVL